MSVGQGAAGSPAQGGAAAPPYVDPERRDALRRKARRDALIASTSLVVVVVVLAVAVTRAPGWSVVVDYFFNAQILRDTFPGLLQAFVLNIKIFLVAEPLILVFGLVIALARVSRTPLMFPARVAAILYTDVFRGIPTILLILMLGFGIPALRLHGVPSDPLVWGVVALVLSYGAYVAEVYRAGILSVHPSQRAAARSLGLTAGQTTRHVVLPQAVRRVLPPLLNDFISLQKDTALVAVIGPIEVLRQAQIDSSSLFNYTPYVGAALLFIALTIPMTRFADWLSHRVAVRQSAGGTT